MRLSRVVCLVLLACLAIAAAAAAEAARPKAFIGATVIHPDRDGAAAIVRDAVVVVEGDRIKAIGPSNEVTLPPGVQVINVHRKWIVPGLVDGHVHFFQSGNLYTRPDVADFNKVVRYADEVKRNKARLPTTFKVWLASGVTSVVDVGGPMWNFEVRDAARRAEFAPHVAVAGPLVSMIDRPQLDLGDPPIIKITSAKAARDLVQRELARKPDYIKVWFIHRPEDDLAAQEAIVKATADAAHAAGVPLAVHATELITAKAALRTGADYLVHSVDDAPLDEEFIALAKKNHALYCPTLFVTMGYRYALSNTWQATEAEQRLADPAILKVMHDLDRIPKEALPDRVAKAMAERKPVEASQIALDNLRKVHDAGIPVVMGTDAGNIGTLHGASVFREMALMQKAGLTPLDVLRAATVNGAKAMRMEKDLGALAPGKLADFVILDQDPLADLGNLSHIWRVVKGGRALNPQALLRQAQ